MSEKNLPTITDLYNDNLMEMLDKQSRLNALLNQPPKKTWLKKHPYADIMYMPIERVEYLLTRLFFRWHVEVKVINHIANSIVVTVRLHYYDPSFDEMRYQDGVGACPLQTNSGASATDWSQIKSASVQMAAPAAESYAIKDAAEKIGKIFGKDINRKDTMVYDGLKDAFTPQKEELKRIATDLLKECDDELMRANIVERIMDAETMRTDGIDFYQEIIKTLQS